MKIAIVALTRGYPDDRSLYDELIKRNYSIYEKINKHRENSPDLLLFHEGNILQDDQDYINSRYPEEIKFVDVSEYFTKHNFKVEEKEKFSSGYRNMCKFNMFHIWDEVSKYDYILRIDEDTEILDFDPFLFEKMKNKNINFVTGRFSKEIHRLTNRTLPNFLAENTDIDVKKNYNHKFPYTNLYATKVSFWMKPEVKNLLKIIALSDKQAINRWGDIPVLGIILNHKKQKIILFPRLTYKHISHDLNIKNSFMRNITVNSKYNPISIKEGPLIKLKLKLKARSKSDNPFDFDNY